jgi:Ca2+-binding EF-hand superfamily protein
MISREQLFEIYAQKLDQREIEEELNPILEELEFDEDDKFEYDEFITIMVEQTVNSAKD